MTTASESEQANIQSAKLALMAGYSECVNELAEALSQMRRCASGTSELDKAAQKVSDLRPSYDLAVAELERHFQLHGRQVSNL
jgi:hypothetical protein